MDKDGNKIQLLDYNGLKRYTKELKKYLGGKPDNSIIKKSNAEWLTVGDTVPEAGTILLYKDRKKVNDVPVPDIKIADGVTTVNNLPFYGDNIVGGNVEITTDNDTELYLLGALDNSNDIKRNSQVKVQGNTVTAENFNGTATKVANKLTIGTYVYDGSEDVSVPVYDGNFQKI